MGWISDFFRIFVGTPRRFLFTIVGLAAIYCVFNPGWLAGLLQRLLHEILVAVNPLLSPLFQLAIVVFAIAFIFRAAFRGGKRK